MSQIALLSGPLEASQLEATLNAIIQTLNGYVGGNTPLVEPFTSLSSSATVIGPGITSLATTKTTMNFKLGNPTLGQTVTIFASKSTTTGSAGQVVTCNSSLVTFSTTIKKLIFKTKNMCVILKGLSSTSWGIVSNVGTVLTS
jgi:hypothetical protein